MRVGRVRLFYGTTLKPMSFAIQPCGRSHESVRSYRMQHGCVDCQGHYDMIDRERRRNPIGADLRVWIFARNGNRCTVCGAGHDLTVDHVVPVTRGGKTDPDNLQTLCRSCNSAKGPR